MHGTNADMKLRLLSSGILANKVSKGGQAFQVQPLMKRMIFCPLACIATLIRK